MAYAYTYSKAYMRQRAADRRKTKQREALREDMAGLRANPPSEPTGLTANNCFYIWEAIGLSHEGSAIYKVGVASWHHGETRMHSVARAIGCTARILGRYEVRNAQSIERQALMLGFCPGSILARRVDGYTEYRVFTQQELDTVLKLAQDAADELSGALAARVEANRVESARVEAERAESARVEAARKAEALALPKAPATIAADTAIQAMYAAGRTNNTARNHRETKRIALYAAPPGWFAGSPKGVRHAEAKRAYDTAIAAEIASNHTLQEARLVARDSVLAQYLALEQQAGQWWCKYLWEENQARQSALQPADAQWVNQIVECTRAKS